jgi:hypothetical protein
MQRSRGSQTPLTANVWYLSKYLFGEGQQRLPTSDANSVESFPQEEAIGESYLGIPNLPSWVEMVDEHVQQALPKKMFAFKF